MIYAQMIGRNESNRFLDRVLERISSQVDRVIFTDDCSDDDVSYSTDKEVLTNYIKDKLAKSLS